MVGLSIYYCDLQKGQNKLPLGRENAWNINTNLAILLRKKWHKQGTLIFLACCKYKLH